MTAAATRAEPTKEQFAREVDAVFQATAPNGSEVEMVLTEFRDVLDSDTQETFTLTFRAPSALEPEQGTYMMENRGLGEQAIFLVPVKQDEQGLYFEAVYNRFKK